MLVLGGRGGSGHEHAGTGWSLRELQGVQRSCDAPGFLISVINANDRINWVKPVDIGQTLVNQGHHSENRVNKP
jgi:hypothetical protein